MKVLEFPPREEILDTRDLIESAAKDDLQMVIILGYDVEGDFVRYHSKMTHEQALMIIELGKAKLMEYMLSDEEE